MSNRPDPEAEEVPLSEHWLDALGRRAARNGSEASPIGHAMTRRGMLTRAALGSIAIAGLRGLSFPEPARADNFSSCLRAADDEYRLMLSACDSVFRGSAVPWPAPGFSRWRCIVQHFSDRARRINDCKHRYRSPDPEPERPPKKKPPKKKPPAGTSPGKQPKKPAPPPPSPAREYCEECKAVGGKCCPGNGPGGFCCYGGPSTPCPPNPINCR